MKHCLWGLLLASAVAIACTDPPLVTVAVAGTMTDLGAYTGDPRCEDALISTCETDADYSGMVYLGGKVYLPPGGGHAATYENAVGVFDPAAGWSYTNARTPCADRTSANVDAVNGRWISDDLPIPTHTYDLVVPVNGKLLVAAKGQGRGDGCNNLDSTPYVIDSGTFRWYDPALDDGTQNPWNYTSIPAVDYTYAAELDPVSGNVLFARSNGLWLYDGISFTKILTTANSSMGNSAHLIYSAAKDKFYWIGQAGTSKPVWEITLDRSNYANSTVVQTSAVIPSGAGFAWGINPNDGKIYGGLKNGNLYVFDPADYSVATLAFADSYCGTQLLSGHGFGFPWVPELGAFLGRVAYGACHHTILYQP